MIATPSIKERLNEIARRVYQDPKIEVDEHFYTASWGMTLGELLEKRGEKAIVSYWDRKMAKGYE